MTENKTDIREKTCFFTGHRDIPQDKLVEIQSKLEKAIISLIVKGVIYYAVGGAVGFDTIATLTILKLKSKYPKLKLVMILPCKNHHFSWQGSDMKIFEGLKNSADKVVYTAERYYNGCMYKRNRHMAEGSRYCICYQTASTGGTAYTVNYAKSMGVHLINIAEE